MKLPKGAGPLARLRGAWGVFQGKASADYKAASTTGRRLKGWLPSRRDANGALFSRLEELRARSRDLSRNNTWVSSGLSRYVSNAIGTGIVPIHPDEKIRQAFLYWTDQSDATGVSDFYGQQSMVCRAERQDGEVFIRLRPRRLSDGLIVPLQLQVIEADHVPLQENRDEGNETVRAGIIFDAIGRRKAYLMYREHPGSTFGGINSGVLSTIPADQVLHVYQPLRPGQLRGQPWITAAIVTLYDLDQYVDATVLRGKLANLLAFFIRKNGDNEHPTLNETDGEDGTALAGVQPGSVNYLDIDEEPVFNTPVSPGVGFQEFLRPMLRSVATAMNLTYEQLSGDLEGVNFTSIRAGALEFRRQCEAYQHQTIVFQFCRPVWKAWIEAAVLAGLIPASDYARRPEYHLNVPWRPQKWAWVDPQSDLAEAKGKVRAGFASRKSIVAELGEDVEQVDREIKEDNDRADAEGLAFDTDGRRPDGKGAVATAQDPNAVDPAVAKPNSQQKGSAK